MSEKKNTVMVIVGTIDGKKIITELLNSKLKIIAIATTRFKREFIVENDNIELIERRLTVEGMARIIKKHDIKCLIDVSHPFAVEISNNAMKVCKRLEIKYIRYERAPEEFEDPNKKIKKVKSYGDAVKAVSKVDGNIFLNLGTQSIHHFEKEIKKDNSRVYVKALPESNIIKKCEEVGILPSNIIAIKGNLSEEMNGEVLKYCGANTIVMRDSGEAGGYGEKIRAALKLDVNVILFERPEIDYSYKVSTIAEVIFTVGNSMVVN